jgi:hypothetical protein
LSADLHLWGTLRDEDGKPLKNVKICIRRIKAMPLALHRKFDRHEFAGPLEMKEQTAPYMETQTIEVNGEYDIKAPNSMSLSLTFTKGGYDQQNRACKPACDREKMMKEILKKDGMLVGQPVEFQSDVVLLESLVPAWLKMGNAALVIGANNRTPLLDLQRIKYGTISSTHDIAGGEPPDNHMWLSVPMDKEKKKAKTVSCKIQGKDCDVMVERTLSLSGKGAGLILYKPKNERWAGREMKEAPVSGYSRDIDVSLDLPAYLALKPGHRYEKFFFFRTTDGKYGKGSISDNGPGRPLYLQIRISIQPDGSRNLQTTD